MTDILDLVTRLEAASGPDRALDAEIAAALQIVPDFHAEDYIVPIIVKPDDAPWAHPGDVGVWAIHSDGTEHFTHGRAAPRYTASLDAVLTLVPDNVHWEVGRYSGNRHCAWCKGEIIYAPTPALALCAAALKARMT